MSWYWIGLGLVIAGGIAPAAYFLWSWRPRRRWSARQLDAGGWVVVILALYLLAGFRALTGQYREPRSVLDGAAALAVGVAIDTILWLRVTRWVSFRRNPTHPLRRSGDPCDPE